MVHGLPTIMAQVVDLPAPRRSASDIVKSHPSVRRRRTLPRTSAENRCQPPTVEICSVTPNSNEAELGVTANAPPSHYHYVLVRGVLPASADKSPAMRSGSRRCCAANAQNIRRRQPFAHCVDTARQMLWLAHERSGTFAPTQSCRSNSLSATPVTSSRCCWTGKFPWH